MKELRQRKGLGGTVLIMILTVMVVLIIMLMATLTVVTTANQRVYTKFEENQAYYTARSALDVFVQNMFADAKYQSYDGLTTRTYHYGADGSGGDVPMKQGLGLQLDLYYLTATNPGSENITRDALDTYFTGTLTEGEEYKYYFGTDDDMVNDPSYVIYDVYLPRISDEGSGSDYGKLSDYANDGTKDRAHATIKVEVLSREYSLGTYGGGTAVTPADRAAYFAAVEAGTTISTADHQMIAEAFSNGDRMKDKMTIKITATASFDGQEATAVLICDTATPPITNSSNAITTFGGTGSDNMSVIGGASMITDVNWGNNDGVIYGNTYAESDFIMGQNGPALHLTKEESFVVGGNLKYENGGHFSVATYNIDATDKDQRPFIYVNGSFTTGDTNSGNFNNVDLIINNETAPGAAATAALTTEMNGFAWTGDIYCNGDLNLYSGTGINIDGDLYVAGDIHGGYSKGLGAEIDGGGNVVVSVAGVTGTVYLSGDFYYKDWGAGGIEQKVTGVPTTAGLDMSFSANTLSNALPDFSDITDYKGSDEKIEITLPGGVKKKIPTRVKNFNHYYQTDSDGNLIDAAGNKIPPSTNPPVPISAQTMAEAPDVTKPLTAADLGITTNMANLDPGIFSAVGGVFYNNNYNCEIDTAGGIVQCILSDSAPGVDPNTTANYRKGIHIKGGGTVEMVVSGSYGNETMIYVDDDTTLKIVGDCTGGNLWFAKLYVYNETVAKAKSDGSEIYVGYDQTAAGGRISVPKIYYYISGDYVDGDDSHGVFHVDQGSFLTGYYYGPDTMLRFAATNESYNYNYNGNSIGNNRIAVVGSVLANAVKIANASGVAYINPDTSGLEAGEPIHNFTVNQYTRS